MKSARYVIGKGRYYKVGENKDELETEQQWEPRKARNLSALADFDP